jgi:hypothetical protein
MHGLFCFNLITDDNTYLVAATTQVERSKWMEVRDKLIKYIFTAFAFLSLIFVG